MLCPVAHRAASANTRAGWPRRSLTALLCGAVLVASACTSRVSRTIDASGTAAVSASDARFRYEGRIDRAEPASPALIWQASRVSIDFEGTQLAVSFGKASGQNFFDLHVDDDVQVIEVKEGANATIAYASPLSAGRHHLELFKRSEANAGVARFAGIEIGKGKQVWASAAPSYAWRFEFFGDSITVGACNEDGEADQWETRRTHNNANSWATFTAQAFQADWRNIAVSGMGITMGYVPVLAGEVWDRMYPSATSEKADLTAWQPDVVFVNFGENDTSFSHRNGMPFPPSFTDGYVSLVQGIRRAYPQAKIVLLRGGMGGGAEDLNLRAAWEAAVTKLEAGDPAISHYVFKHWSALHPRVADDHAMADELVAWLRGQIFMMKSPRS